MQYDVEKARATGNAQDGEYAPDPVVKAGWYPRCRISNAKEVEHKNSDAASFLLKVQVKDQRGKQVTLSLFTNIRSSAGEENHVGYRKATEVATAAGIAVTKKGFDEDELEGCMVDLKLGIEPERTVRGRLYPERNSLEGARPAGTKESRGDRAAAAEERQVQANRVDPTSGGGSTSHDDLDDSIPF